MNQVKTLDKIILEDRLNLKEKEILERVEHIANERAKLGGWDSFEIKPVLGISLGDSTVRRFEFDILSVSKKSNIQGKKTVSPESNGQEAGCSSLSRS